MYTLNTVLFPIDFYHDETHTLRHVRSLVDPQKTEVIFVHIVDQTDSAARLAEEKFAPEEWIEKLVQIGASMGLTCHGEIQSGTPKSVILNLAARRGADCIAVPTAGRFAVDRLLESSLCMQLIHESEVPVMAITPTMGPPRRQGTNETLPRTIVCTIDASSGLESLYAALGIALPIHATVIAIHPGKNIPDRLREEVQQLFQSEEFKSIRGGISCTRKLTTDDIVNATRTVEAHLLVMPSELQVDSRMLSNASTAESVISLCGCPVLALPTMVHASR